MSSIKKTLVVVGLAAIAASVWTVNDEAKARQVVAALVVEAESGQWASFEEAK